MVFLLFQSASEKREHRQRERQGLAPVRGRRQPKPGKRRTLSDGDCNYHFLPRLQSEPILRARACRYPALCRGTLLRCPAAASESSRLRRSSCREADLTVTGLPRARPGTTGPAERQIICHYRGPGAAESQICHYGACREANLSLPRLPRGKSVTTGLAESQLCHYRACREGNLSLPRLSRGKSVTTALAKRQICHYRAVYFFCFDCS